jgi:hypothetical protein
MHDAHVAVVGFVRDSTLSPIDSTIAFTNSPLMAHMVAKFKLPVGEEAALGMRNLCDAIQALRYVLE